MQAQTKEYPIPATQYLFIDKGENVHYKLLDLDGKIIKEGIFNKILNIQKLSTGLYSLLIDGNIECRFFKI